MSTKNVTAMDIEFRKQVALIMLPIIYKETPKLPNLRGRITDAVEMAVEIAKKMDNIIDK